MWMEYNIKCRLFKGPENYNEVKGCTSGGVNTRIMAKVKLGTKRKSNQNYLHKIVFIIYLSSHITYVIFYSHVI